MKQPILVIEDDLDNQEGLRDRLYGLGFDVLTTDCGHQGLTLIGEQASMGRPVAGILLNLRMPRFDGMAVLARLQDRHPNVPVIMMSSLPKGLGLEAEALRRGREIILRSHLRSSRFAKNVYDISRLSMGLEYTTGGLLRLRVVSKGDQRDFQKVLLLQRLRFRGACGA